MSFGNPLQKTHSRGTKRFVADPVTEATMKGKVPTLRDVKRSVKVCKIVNACGALDHVFLAGLAEDINTCHVAHGRAA